MNPFTFILTDYGITADQQSKYADLYAVLSLAADLYSSGYSGGPNGGAYRYAIAYFTTRFGAQHDFVRRFAFEFNGKAQKP